MTFIDKNSSSHTAQSVTLYLQKWENQTVEVRRAPRLLQAERLKATSMKKHGCRSSWATTVWFVSSGAIGCSTSCGGWRLPSCCCKTNKRRKTVRIKLGALWRVRLSKQLGKSSRLFMKSWLLKTGSLTCSHTNLSSSIMEEFDLNRSTDWRLTGSSVVAGKAFLCQQGAPFHLPSCKHAAHISRAGKKLLWLYLQFTELLDSLTQSRDLDEESNPLKSTEESARVWSSQGQVLTSYFCSFSFSMWSNFSDSSWRIQSYSSLILSLQETHRTSSLALTRLALFKNAGVLQFVFVQVVDVQGFTSGSQNLLLLLSLSLFLTSSLLVSLISQTRRTCLATKWCVLSELGFHHLTC